MRTVASVHDGAALARLRELGEWSARGRVHYVAAVLVVAAVYFTTAELGLRLDVAHGVITPVWAPTGIALAALVLLGRRLWPAVALAAFAANATSGAGLGLAAVIAAGNTLEALVGATLLLLVGFRPALDRVRDVLALVVLAAAVSTTISATVGVTALELAGDLGESYGAEWLLWWLGDAMGDLVVAPLLFVWLAAPPPRPGARRLLEAGVLLSLLVAVSSVVFLAGAWRYPHVLFPLLIWAPLRFGQPGTVTANFVVTALAIAGGVSAAIPLGSGEETQVVQILEGLFAAVVSSLLVLGAVLAERGRAQAGLGQANATLAEAQRVARLGSWEWTVGSDEVTWSDELYRLFGLEPGSAQLTYASFIDRVHPNDRETVRRAVEAALADHGPFEFDHRVLVPSGAVRWLHARGRVVVDGGGRAVRMVGTAQDVTERKELDELRDSILSTVSHELRTPLASIIGFALTLNAREVEDETRAEMIRHLTEQAQKLDRLLSDLLDLDRLRRGFVHVNRSPTDVAQLVRDVASAHAADGRPIEVHGHEIVADVDGPKVERIVDNLLANAVKHTPRDARISARVEQNGDGVLIAVDDSGNGVPEDLRGRIFEIFNRGALDVTGAPGAGVGLALVAQFAALHRGRAWVEETPGGGASFRVLLRAGEEQPAP